MIVATVTERPSVACRCGRLYFEGQEAALWACVREHMEVDRRVREGQDFREALSRPRPRRSP